MSSVPCLVPRREALSDCVWPSDLALPSAESSAQEDSGLMFLACHISQSSRLPTGVGELLFHGCRQCLYIRRACARLPGDGWYDVTVISPLNYFTYTPLLPGAATGNVELRSITEAVRSLVAGAP